MDKRKIIEEIKKAVAIINPETEIDEKERDNKKLLKHEVLSAIKKSFEQKFENMKNRTEQEQNFLGNFLTVFEMELKSEIKKLPEVEC